MNDKATAHIIFVDDTFMNIDLPNPSNPNYVLLLHAFKSIPTNMVAELKSISIYVQNKLVLREEYISNI